MADTPSSDGIERYLSYLRYYIDDSEEVIERAGELARYCADTKIDGVMLFTGAHERQPWVLERTEFHTRAETLAAAASVLRAAGLRVAVNVITTLGHDDPGPPPGGSGSIPFQPMVDIDGTAAEGIPCPIDPRYLSLMGEFYAHLARVVKPETIWVDDDLRYSWHYPAIAIGCFCPRHLKRFAAAMGRRDIDREEAATLLTGIGGDPDDTADRRRLFSEVLREGLQEFAETLRKAVDRGNPEVRIGYMSNSAEIDRLTGLSYHDFCGVLAGGTRSILRPNLGMYRDGERRLLPLALDTSFLVSAVAGPETECVTEIDGHWPHSRFHRSSATILNAVVASTFFGITTHSYFLFAFGSVPFAEIPEYGEALRSHRRLFERIAEETASCDEVKGIRVWYDDDRSVFHLPASEATLEAFAVDRNWITRLALLGLPIAYTGSGPCVLAADQGSAITEVQLREELKRGVLIEGAAAATLVERGLGRLIGVERMESIDSLVTAEHLDVERFSGGFPGRKISIGPGLTPRNHFYRIVPAGAAAASTLLERYLYPAGPGIVVYENSEGGRAAVTAYGRNGSAYPVIYLNDLRRAQLRSVFEWLGGSSLPVSVLDKPDVWVMSREHPDRSRRVVLAVNLSFDPAPSVHIALGGLSDGRWSVSRMGLDGGEEVLSDVETAGAPVDVDLPLDLQPQEAAVLLLRRHVV